MMLITLARYAATLAGTTVLAAANRLTVSQPWHRPALVQEATVPRSSGRWS